MGAAEPECPARARDACPATDKPLITMTRRGRPHPVGRRQSPSLPPKPTRRDAPADDRRPRSRPELHAARRTRVGGTDAAQPNRYLERDQAARRQHRSCRGAAGANPHCKTRGPEVLPRRSVPRVCALAADVDEPRSPTGAVIQRIGHAAIAGGHTRTAEIACSSTPGRSARPRDCADEEHS
jgi:hypothetical protein